jgi:signal transduction histidine kinase/DNA-binding response OmpR family regulator
MLCRIFLLLIAGIVFFLPACKNKEAKKEFVIGFSQCVEDDLWRRTMLEDMKRELAFHENISFYYKEANNSSTKQIKQVKELLDKDIDLLIISPNEAAPLTPVVEEVYKKGIPVIIIDRKIASDLYNAFIGADNYQVGKIAGEYAANLLNKSGKIVEVMGLPGSSPAMERNKGFTDAIKPYPDLHITRQIQGNWLREQAFAEVKKQAAEVAEADLVFAQNDMMAIATRQALESEKINSPVKIIGIDALPGKDAGIEFVSNKQLTASVLYPTGGQEAIRVAIKISMDRPYEKENILNTIVVDSTNVRVMKMQTDRIISQHADIERQQAKLDEQIRAYKDQKTFNNILITAFILVFVLGGIVFISWRKNRRITEKLKHQNIEISDQKNQLVEMSIKAEEAHHAKLNFFTNISHEFRTPLTLILAPLEELESNPKILPATKKTIQLVQRNVLRLYKLVNQLMDFRKIEFDKMKIRASQVDLVAFTREIMETYSQLAKNKNIDLRFFTKENSLLVWLDVTMIDKVIFNLITNAFKFTRENGYIYVSIEKKQDAAIIKIEDNGVGMTKDTIDHVFEPFFQGEYENFKGTGLGLALSKELIEMHGGSIQVTSEKWKGTEVQISLPINKNESNASKGTFTGIDAVIKEDAKMYTTEFLTPNEPVAAINYEEIKFADRPSLLIVEDNTDLRQYLASKLISNFDIMEAENGNAAINLAFDNIPDLVICDVVIPGKNGLEITRILKNDVRTSHIPILLLTARSEESQKIAGLETQADAYLTKPFSLPVLHTTVNSLLTNREKIKLHYSGEIMADEKSQVAKKIDRKFLAEFSAIVETNLANEKMNVDDIASQLGISRVQLYRKVKALLNCNVNDYIISTRLKKAKYYLQHEDLTMSEIAYKTGFSSAAYFSTVFKSKFGCSPTEYKNKKVTKTDDTDA